jgi:hypothetical protein
MPWAPAREAAHTRAAQAKNAVEKEKPRRVQDAGITGSWNMVWNPPILYQLQ